MSTAAVMFAVVICGTLWGGFLALVVQMVRSESRKVKAAERART